MGHHKKHDDATLIQVTAAHTKHKQQQHLHSIIKTPQKKRRNVHSRYIKHATMKNAPWAAAARDYDRQQARYRKWAGKHQHKKHHKTHHKKHDDATLIQV